MKNNQSKPSYNFSKQDSKKQHHLEQKPIKVKEWLKENAIEDNRSYFTGYNEKGVPTFYLKIDSKKVREDYLKQIDEVINQYDKKENFGARVKNNNIEIKIINKILDDSYSQTPKNFISTESTSKEKSRSDESGSCVEEANNSKTPLSYLQLYERMVNNVPVVKIDISEHIKQSNQNVPVVKNVASQYVKHSNEQVNQKKLYNAILDKDDSFNNGYKPKSQVNQIKYQQLSPNYFGKTKF